RFYSAPLSGWPFFRMLPGDGRIIASVLSLYTPQKTPRRSGEFLCGALVLLAGVGVRGRGTAGLELLQLGLQQGLQAGAVLALVGAQLRDAGLQGRLLLLDGRHDLRVLALGVGLQGVRLLLGLTDLGLGAG